jgi:hypothetical protein
MKNYFLLPAALIIIFFFGSCSTYVYEKAYPTLLDGKYDSEFPYNSAHKQLEEISNSIRLINCVAFYTRYDFDLSDQITASTLSGIRLHKEAKNQTQYNRSLSGTGTVISNKLGSVLVLSVAHVVNFPDTIIINFFNDNGSATEFISSISIKTNQNIYIPDFPENSKMEILALDKQSDVALLGSKMILKEAANISVFNYPWGKSNELEWGSFVYVFAYPMNYKMISKAIVSNPKREKNTFLIDAVFNRGSSGGIVLAIRDGVPNFELVGLVKSVPADYELFMRPLIKESAPEFNSMLPYKGEIFVDKTQTLRTGITKVIGIEAVTNFFKQNKNLLAGYGFDPESFNLEETIK